METTLEQAMAAAVTAATANGTAFGDFGTVDTEASFTHRDKDGAVLFHVVEFSKGQMIMAADTDLPPLLFMSHGKGSSWLRQETGYDPAALLKTTVDSSHRAAGVGKYANKGALRSAGNDAYSEVRTRSASAWGRLLGKTPLSAGVSASPPAPPSSTHPQIFPTSDLDGSPVVLRGWERMALGATEFDFDYSDWTQGTPSNVLKFNNLIPGKNAVGCVAVALSQLQAYNKWPRRVERYVHPADSLFAAEAADYNWWRVNPAAVANPIGRPKYLMDDETYGRISYNTGVYCLMQYSGSYAGSMSSCQLTAMRRFLGYPHAKMICARPPSYVPGMTEEQVWSTRPMPSLKPVTMGRVIYDSLRAKQAVLFSISVSGSYGHAVIGVGIGTVKTDVTHDTQYAGEPVVFVDVGWGGDEKDPTNHGGSGWYPLPYIYTTASNGGTVSMYNSIDNIVVQTTPFGGPGNTRSLPLRGKVVDTSGVAGDVKVTVFSGSGAMLASPELGPDGSFITTVDPTLCQGTCQIEVRKVVDRTESGLIDFERTTADFVVGPTVRTMTGVYPNDCQGDPEPRTFATQGGGIPIDEDTYVADLPHPTVDDPDFDGVFVIDISVPGSLRSEEVQRPS